MGVLVANLRHLWQRRIGWLMIAMFGFLGWGIGSGVYWFDQHGEWVILTLPYCWVMFIGAYIASYAADVINKPLSFCMPGHLKAARGFLFTAGGLISLYWSVLFGFSVAKAGGANPFITAVASFALLSIVYWLEVFLVMAVNLPMVTLIAMVIVPVIDLQGIADYMNSLTQGMVLSFIITNAFPAIPIVIGLIVNIAMWRVFGNVKLVRQYCGQKPVGLNAKITPGNSETVNGFRVNKAVENFFDRKLNSCKYDSFAHSLWGSFYRSFAILLTRICDWRWITGFVILICLVTLGYPFVVMLSGVAGIFAGMVRLNLDSNFLVINSRRRKFYLAFSTALTGWIIVGVIGLIGCGLQYLFSLSISHNGLLQVSQWFLLSWIGMMILAPVSFTLTQMFRKHPIVLLLAYCFIAIAYVCVSGYWIEEIVAEKRNGIVFLELGKSIILWLVLGQWFVFAVVLDIICCRAKGVVKRILQIAVLLLIAFAGRVVYLATALPQPSVDYVGNYNDLLRPDGFDESKNAWPIYEKAILAYEPMGKELEEIYRYIDEEPLTAEQVAIIKVWLAKNKTARKYLEQAVVMPSNYYVRVSNDGSMGKMLGPELSSMKNLAKMIYANCFISVYDRDFSGIVSEMQLLTDMADHMYHKDGTSLERLVALSIRGLAVKCAESALLSSGINREDLVVIYDELTQFPDKLSRSSHSTGELYFFFDALQRSYVFSVYRKGRLAWRSNLFDSDLGVSKYSMQFYWYKFLECAFGETEAQVIHRLDKLVAMNNLLIESELLPWQLDESQLANEMRAVDYLKFPLSDMGKMALRYYVVPYLTTTRAKCIQSAIAVKLYSIDNGVLPDSLQSVVDGGYLPVVPDDPFHDGKLVYKITEDGFVVYSYGGNYIDDYDNAGSENNDIVVNVSSGNDK